MINAILWTLLNIIFSHVNQLNLFWSEIERWWNDKSTCPVVLTEKHAINYIILLGKMYIYRHKINENTIYFNYFLNELKFKLDIEKIICETNQEHT